MANASKAKAEPVEEGETKASSDHFVVEARKVRSLQQVEIKLVGWVGDGFVFPAAHTKELIGALQAVEKKLP